MITQVTNTLFIGDWQDAVMISKFGRSNTKDNSKIMTVAFDSEFKGDYVFPLVDGYSDNNEENTKQFFDAVIKLFQLQNDNIPVLVHCVSGRSRSASVIIAYLMMSRRITYDKAYNMLFAIRPIIEPKPFFVELLKDKVY